MVWDPDSGSGIQTLGLGLVWSLSPARLLHSLTLLDEDRPQANMAAQVPRPPCHL